MGDDDLKSFKIGDRKRPEVRTGGRQKDEAEAEAPPSVSAGFPEIESRLENESIEDVAEALKLSYEQLEALADTGTMKAKAGAKKAMVAYERAADLLEYLYETKETLENPPEADATESE